MKHKSPREVELETIAVLAVVALLFYLLFHKLEFVLLSLGLLCIGLFCTTLAENIVRLWLKLSEMLGAFNSKIVLGGISRK